MRLLLVVAAMTLVPLAAAHGDEHEPRIAGDEDALLGTIEGGQPGRLVVVPFTDGPLTCAAAAGDPGIPLGDVGAVVLRLNATHLMAMFDVSAPAFAAILVDTNDAVRSLIEMQENAVAIHRLTAAVAQDAPNGVAAREGLAGVPYPTADGHAAHQVPGLEPTIRMSHERDASERACMTDEPGHFGLVVPRAALPDALADGAIVHVVLMADDVVAEWIPRPIETSTAVAHANLYLARPGEDAARVRDGLDPALGLRDAAPLAALLSGVVWLAAAGRRRP